ncbi:CRISPR-associated protein (Cas_GSU0053) [Maioricimonas rarisocia]|uniref:CRISPR-associated protein (Cas_GSU0053) n=1 Tax=Maioricimonas rarisocia TaxID=2528026 RepID=A0A517ZB35_9PLAN|nr:type I-U CRISPR-associated RAMP protein Csb1/Cas7u [Maioricimonas rarisocia]QDU39640.1 CRISPR-associated protein (Cas_GSU0053) [Maioricimonas rarisocia]
MTLDFSALENEPRLLIEVPLRPVQGSRFQPTGFPDLGAATFTGFNDDGEPVDCLLVESAQSMANRLEAVCWDEAEGDLVVPLNGLPYVKSTLPDGTVTDSIREAHRLNSPYIVNSKEFEAIRDAIGFEANKPFDRRRLASALLKYDPSSLLHGVFLEKVGGVVRLSRVISAFVEAEGIEVAAAGGVKVDRVQPGTGESTPYGKANEGYGNVPYHRDEYTSRNITASFNIDLAQLRAYGLGTDSENLLIALALFKVRRFLRDGLRLRTACDLTPVSDPLVTRPQGYELPDLNDIEAALPNLIEAASPAFADPRVTEVTYKK